jgi:hypothetical protein
MICWARRLLFIVGGELLLLPFESVPWHHRLLGVFVTLAGLWCLSFVLFRD